MCVRIELFIVKYIFFIIMIFFGNDDICCFSDFCIDFILNCNMIFNNFKYNIKF